VGIRVFGDERSVFGLGVINVVVVVIIIIIIIYCAAFPGFFPTACVTFSTRTQSWMFSISSYKYRK